MLSAYHGRIIYAAGLAARGILCGRARIAACLCWERNSVRVDSTLTTVLDKVGSLKRVPVLSIFAIKYGTSRLRTPRGIAAVLLMVTYLLAGALHGLCDLDVAAPSGKGVITMAAAKDVDTSGKGIAAEHHCHGCFSVSMSTPLLASATIEPKAAAIRQPLSRNSDLVPAIDTPPPKLLS
jgi:hypothetical protein